MFYRKRIEKLEEENRNLKETVKKLTAMMDKPNLTVGDEVKSREEKVMGKLVKLYLAKAKYFECFSWHYSWVWKAKVFDGKELITIDANLLTK